MCKYPEKTKRRKDALSSEDHVLSQIEKLQESAASAQEENIAEDSFDGGDGNAYANEEQDVVVAQPKAVRPFKFTLHLSRSCH